MDDFSLVPVDHQPDFDDVSLIPVDHDPFGDSGTVQRAPTQPAQIPIQSPQTQPQTQQAQPEPQTQAQQSVTEANQPGVNGPATSSIPGGSSGGAGVGNAGIDPSNPTSGPGSASGSASSSIGKGLLQATINAVVPGAYYSNLAQQQFRQGNYGAATVYGVAALGDAALGAATLGASTRLGTGVRAAGTLVPATTEGVGLGPPGAGKRIDKCLRESSRSKHYCQKSHRRSGSHPAQRDNAKGFSAACRFRTRAISIESGFHRSDCRNNIQSQVGRYYPTICCCLPEAL